MLNRYAYRWFIATYIPKTLSSNHHIHNLYTKLRKTSEICKLLSTKNRGTSQGNVTCCLYLNRLTILILINPNIHKKTFYQNDNSESWDLRIQVHSKKKCGITQGEALSEIQHARTILLFYSKQLFLQAGPTYMSLNTLIQSLNDTTKQARFGNLPDEIRHIFPAKMKHRSVLPQISWRFSWNVSAFSLKCQVVFQHKPGCFPCQTLFFTPLTRLLKGIRC